jgi:NAD(P)-dependent dehydrogenase (short-subunit alcohol dehydrogenase family)
VSPPVLEGKVALVTGGSRGLGLQMCHAFAAAGADVIVASRKAEACQAAAAELQEQYGRRALGIACNVGDWEQCDALVEQAYAEFGQVDVWALVDAAKRSAKKPSRG